MENNAVARKNRIQNIRASLQLNSIIKTNTNMVENKLQKRKKRKQSLNINDDNLQTQDQFHQDDSSIKAISKFDEKYKLGEKIGQGSNGLVRKCYLKQTDELFAVKTMMMDDEHILFLKNNFKFIRKLDCPYIIKYRAMYLDLRKHICYLVMDFESLPNLQQIKDLNENQIQLIIYQLLKTLQYIHSQGICHRDIKPDNILYDRKNQTIKVIDFGISKKIKQRQKKRQMLTITGTLFYRAPQMFLGGGYDQKVDIWAAGITLYYLVCRKTPFQSQYHTQTIHNIEKGQIQFGKQWSQFNKFAKDLVIRLLRQREQRLSANQALSHLWLHDLRNSIDLTKSDNLKLTLKAKFSDKNVEQTDFRFQRSLTNHKEKLSIDSIDEKGQINKNKLNSLKKWLSGSDDEDNLIEIQSQGELQKQSPYIHKNSSNKIES